MSDFKNGDIVKTPEAGNQYTVVGPHPHFDSYTILASRGKVFAYSTADLILVPTTLGVEEAREKAVKAIRELYRRNAINSDIARVIDTLIDDIESAKE